MTAYYNENDPFTAEWLRTLIYMDLIAPGDVDDRSIEDVRPDDLAGYTQCHFFAGIGTWSFALRNAGWPDDRPVWTGSPPCQPFSLAGRGGGYDDARHLAPKWLDLVKECRPPEVIGEQVASAFANAKHHWIDDLQDALEAEGYAVGKIVLPACSVGAPHIRQRGWFVAQRMDNPKGERRQGRESLQGQGEGNEFIGTSPDSGLGDTCGQGLQEQQRERRNLRKAQATKTREASERGSASAGGLADAGNSTGQQSEPRATERGLSPQTGGDVPEPGTGAPHSLWQSADWLLCRDGKWRPVEPGTFPLVDGAAQRVGRLRGYGNGIQAQVAEEFIRAHMGAEL